MGHGQPVLGVARVGHVGHVAVLVHPKAITAAVFFEEPPLVEILLLHQLADWHPLEELHGCVADGDPALLPVSNLRCKKKLIYSWCPGMREMITGANDLFHVVHDPLDIFLPALPGLGPAGPRGHHLHLALN